MLEWGKIRGATTEQTNDTLKTAWRESEREMAAERERTISKENMTLTTNSEEKNTVGAGA